MDPVIRHFVLDLYCNTSMPPSAHLVELQRGHLPKRRRILGTKVEQEIKCYFYVFTSNFNYFSNVVGKDRENTTNILRLNAMGFLVFYP